MSPFKTTAFSLLLLLALGCKPDPDPPTPPPPPVTAPSQIRAGVVDSGMVHQQFFPPKELTIIYDSTGIYGAGSATLDMDLNGSNDITFSISIINPDSHSVIIGPPTLNPSFTGMADNGFSISSYIQTFYVGLGTYVNYTMGDTLQFQGRIDTLTEWADDWRMWNLTTSWGTIPPVFGAWYYANSTYYLGVHRAGFQYGWIEIDNSDVNFPKILSCAYWPIL